MKKHQGEHLYKINKKIKCLQCGNKGAIQFYGDYYPYGLGDEVDEFKLETTKNLMEKYRNNHYMSYACGPGGTIPWSCMNCSNTGLIDFGGLEGYKQAFETIREE